MSIGEVLQFRAEFDASVAFANGGDLQVRGFRVDVPHRDTSRADVAALFISALGLLMSQDVTLHSLRIVEEQHKGTRGGPSDPTLHTTPAGTQRLVELNHVIEEAMVTYPGLPGPEIEAVVSREASRAVYSDGVEFAIDRINLVGNTGTYVDSPYHRYPEGADLADMPLDRLADLPTIVVRATGSGTRAVGVETLLPYSVAGAATLIQTGHDRYWRTDAYLHSAPFLTEAGARWLVDQGVALVGIDSVNIDDVADLARPAHSVLLAAGVPVVEHLTGLDQLPISGARFTAAPPRLKTFGTFPVRSFASVP